MQQVLVMTSLALYVELDPLPAAKTSWWIVFLNTLLMEVWISWKLSYQFLSSLILR